MDRRFSSPNYLKSYAGRSISACLDDPSQTGKKVRGQMKCSPWASRLWVWCGANNPIEI
jgi:hypothetical protein